MDDRKRKISELKNMANILNELESKVLDIVGMILAMQKETWALIEKLESK